VKIAGNQSSGALSSMVKANCLIVVPEDVHEIESGKQVEIEIHDWRG
jgi:molybdopterin biosynthesis enzyme